MRPIVSCRVGGEAHRERRGRLGEPVWGPSMWLADLELRLGLPPPPFSAGERVQSYAQCIGAIADGCAFIARSFDADPLATAATVLSWRDALVEAGWSGAPVAGGGPRLDVIATIEAVATGVPDGVGERLCRVEAELERIRSGVYASIRLLEPVQAWPGRWQRVFALLRAKGTVVDAFRFEVRPEAGASDLALAHAALLHPTASRPPVVWRGDGSLLWLRSRTSMELAELTAAVIASRSCADCLIVRNGDVGPLEIALETQGLCPQGRAPVTPLRPPLQVLPLALSLLFQPRDPFRALELLTLPDGPLGPRVSRYLARAIARRPGIGSPAWCRAKEKLGTPREQSAESPEDLRRRIEQIEAWFEGPSFSRSEGAPIDELVRATTRVRAWAHARAQLSDVEQWAPLLFAATELERMLSADHRGRLRPHELDALCKRALSPGMAWEVSVERAGRPAHSTGPHGVLDKHDVIVIWHAGYEAARAVPRQSWRKSEVRALEAAGVTVADPEVLLRVEAGAWRRTVLAARSTLVVATPDSQLGGTQLSLPVWDEIVARSGSTDQALEPLTVGSDPLLRAGSDPRLPGLVTPEVEPLELPAERSSWQVTAEILRRALDANVTITPGSLETMLGCPLRWLLEEVAPLPSGELVSVPEKALLYGNLGHRLAELLHGAEAFDDGSCDEDAAERLVDHLVETEGGPLLLPGMASERAQVRAQLLRAMSVLGELFDHNGLTLSGVEVGAQAEWQGRTLSGRLDLLLEDRIGRDVVVDLKWGHDFYWQKLEKGAALQLAAYAETQRRSRRLEYTPAAAYFSLKRARAMSLAGSGLQGARMSNGPSLELTWQRAERTALQVLAFLTKGAVPVPGVGSEDPLLSHLGVEDLDDHYELPGHAACGYCDKGAICGRAWRGHR